MVISVTLYLGLRNIITCYDTFCCVSTKIFFSHFTQNMKRQLGVLPTRTSGLQILLTTKFSELRQILPWSSFFLLSL